MRKQTFEEIMIEAAKAADKALTEIKLTKLKAWVKEAADQFYDASTFAPRYYHRNHSLYKALIVHQNETNFSAELSSDHLTAFERGGGSDALYELVYAGGWHGGAASGDGHPKPVTPYYRVPPYKWTLWSRAAVHSKPPEEYVTEHVEEFRDHELDDLQEELLLKYANEYLSTWEI